MKFLKGTKIYSILTGSCPVCHNESMYAGPKSYRLMENLNMRERCSSCQTKYKIEPSFFYGAMYVSYPVGLFFAGIAFVISHLILDFELLTSYYIIVLVMLLLLPVILRVSRNIWINFFMSYGKPKRKRQNPKVKDLMS
ncbi:DUF983 domain-containing protein [Spongiimicrobium salis]|uniref:DUF983 domain-containing protein n=1 Tax=Spongiimicrobium salis TaxID=1667022 RepID=UPI00374D072E